MIKFKYIILVILLIGLESHAQNWKKSIEHINNFTKEFDPYLRTFSYNPSTNKLKWYDKDNETTYEVSLDQLKLSFESYYVKFECLDNSKCIYSSHDSSYIFSTSITINKAEIAQKIVKEIISISASNLTNNNSEYQEIINKINNLTNQYDLFKFTFTYDPNSDKLTWYSENKDLKNSAFLNKINIFNEPYGRNFEVIFSSIDKEKSIERNYNGKIETSSITLTNKDAANEITSALLRLKKISKNLESSIVKTDEIVLNPEIEKNIIKINELCVNYDPYIRKFSFNSSNNLLRWVDKDKEINLHTDLNKISISISGYESEYSVIFKCINDSNCIQSQYTGPTNLISITINDKNAASEILNLLNDIKEKIKEHEQTDNIASKLKSDKDNSALLSDTNKQESKTNYTKPVSKITINDGTKKMLPVKFNSHLQDLKLYIDGKDIGKIPQQISLMTGTHDLKLERGTDMLEKYITVNPDIENEFNFWNRDFVKSFYKKHYLSFSYGYHETNFLNETFTARIANGTLKKDYGQAATLSTMFFPFELNVTAFNSNFRVSDVVPFNDNSVITHQGIEIGMNFIPINIGKGIFIYFGGGYQISQLFSAKGNTKIEGEASSNTTLPILKGGLRLKFGQIYFFGEFKQSLSTNESNFNSQQFHAGIGLTL